jgi:hypothetical protein
MLSLLLHSLPGVRAVCTLCKDTIAPAHADATCPLGVGIAANAQMFIAKSLGSSPRVILRSDAPPSRSFIF